MAANMMTLLGGAAHSRSRNNSFGVDGIREYKVVTTSFSAEYGQSMGSQMLMVSKGGSNQFHGDAFEYIRKLSDLDAKNLFDTPASSNGGGASRNSRKIISAAHLAGQFGRIRHSSMRCTKV